MATELAERLVAAYRPYVHRRLSEQGIEVAPRTQSALLEGEVWLAEELAEVLALPFPQQPRGPLQIFQEAMRFPTRALQQLAVPPPRDRTAEEALPGDPYHLVPASSSSLGEEAWQAHLAWGAAKAKAVAPLVLQAAQPQIAVLTRNLMDRARVEEAAGQSGLPSTACASVKELEAALAGGPPALALVDLTHPEAEQAIRRLSESGVASVAFGPHVDEAALQRARRLGAVDALPRSRFFRCLPELLAAGGEGPSTLFRPRH
ncbi:MAG: hypothetical protein M3N51_09725 [Actinomycetota bacterium]|nr:hypothetical protein [Actinomycetota bacterium]